MAFPFRKMKARRKALGLSREQVAEISGVGVRRVQSLELGKNPNPEHETIVGLCAALQVSCEFFFTEDIPPHADPDPDPAPPTKGKGRPKK